MKRYIITLLIMISFASISWAQTVEVAGSWQLDWNKIYNAMSSSEQSRFNGLPEQTRSRITSSFSSRTYEFQTDGTLEISWQSNSGSKTENGTWSISGTTLSMVVNSQEKTYNISRSNDTLTLTMSGAGTGAVTSNLVMNKL